MNIEKEKELYKQMDLLQMKEVSTYRQQKNGTRIFELPIIKYGSKIQVGSFQSGYVRRMNGCYTPYQLNKCEPNVEYYPEYKGYIDKNGDWRQRPTGKYNKFVGKRRIIIDTKEERLEHLITYCLKNYYIKLANQVEDGKFVPKWLHERRLGHFLKCEDTDDFINFKYSGGQIENLENGDVFIHEQHAYWNKWKEDSPASSVELIIDGHRYKVK